MADEGTDKFRERVEQKSLSGLIKQEDNRAVLPTSGISFGAVADAFDLSASIVDTLTSGDENKTLTNDIDNLLRQQKLGKCRNLLEHAQDLISIGKWREAQEIASEALLTDPKSGEALALRGRCLVEIEQFRVGHRSLSVALQFIADVDLRALVLRWDSTCIRSYTKKLVDECELLMQSGQIPQAQIVIDEGLKLQPSNLVLLSYLAHLHWKRGDNQSAERIVAEARIQTGGKSVDIVCELERIFCFREHASTIENVRQALRRNDPNAAIKLLDICHMSLKENEHYDGLREYAQSRRKEGSSTRPPSASSTPQGALRQQTLRWILGEEIKSAEQALDAGGWRKALEALKTANEIDPDCGLVQLLMASALLTSYRQKPHETHSAYHISISASEYEEVAALLRRVSIDQGLEEQAQKLQKLIAEHYPLKKI